MNQGKTHHFTELAKYNQVQLMGSFSDGRHGAPHEPQGIGRKDQALAEVPLAQRRLRCTLDLLLFFFFALVSCFGFLGKRKGFNEKTGMDSLSNGTSLFIYWFSCNESGTGRVCFPAACAEASTL